MSLTQARLKEVLHYDPETGIFTWRNSPARNVVAGAVAGSIGKKGYKKVSIDGKHYSQHRLAFLYMTGSFPPEQVDHVNRIRGDNRYSNLRLVSNADNNRNTKLCSTNTSGVMGVTWHRCTRKWQATIRHEGQTVYLGLHNDWLDAVCTRKSHENLYGYHPNHGRSATAEAAELHGRALASLTSDA